MDAQEFVAALPLKVIRVIVREREELIEDNASHTPVTDKVVTKYLNQAPLKVVARDASYSAIWFWSYRRMLLDGRRECE